MYKYLDRDPQLGDIVEYKHTVNTGKPWGYRPDKLYVVASVSSSTLTTHDTDTKPNGMSNFKVIATKPDSEAQVGDTVISLTAMGDIRKPGDVFTVSNLTRDGFTYCATSNTSRPNDFKVLCKPEEPQIPVGSQWERLESTSIYYAGEIITVIESDHDGYITYNDSRALSKDRFLETFKPYYKPQEASVTVAEQPAKPQIKKENLMNLQSMIDEIFGNDYDNRPNHVVIIYNANGSERATAYADSVEDVENLFAKNPRLIGCTANTYKLSKEIKVELPVVTSKATPADA